MQVFGLGVVERALRVRAARVLVRLPLVRDAVGQKQDGKLVLFHS